MNKYWEQSKKLKIANQEIEKLITNKVIIQALLDNSDHKTILSFIEIQKTLLEVSTLLEDTDKAINQTVNLFDKLQG